MVKFVSVVELKTHYLVYAPLCEAGYVESADMRLQAFLLAVQANYDVRSVDISPTDVSNVRTELYVSEINEMIQGVTDIRFSFKL